jgi:hypothetical protein
MRKFAPPAPPEPITPAKALLWYYLLYFSCLAYFANSEDFGI